MCEATEKERKIESKKVVVRMDGNNLLKKEIFDLDSVCFFSTTLLSSHHDFVTQNRHHNDMEKYHFVVLTAAGFDFEAAGGKIIYEIYLFYIYDLHFNF